MPVQPTSLFKTGISCYSFSLKLNKQNSLFNVFPARNRVAHARASKNVHIIHYNKGSFL